MTSVWWPDAPPAVAGSRDDEFDGESGGVPNLWTEVDHGAHQTVSEDALGLVLSQATHVGESVSGIYKAIPAGDFSVWSRISLSTLMEGSAAQGGLGLWENATSSTGDVVTYSITPTSDIRVETRAAYNVIATATDTEDLGGDMPSHVYLRIRRSGTTYSFDFSSNGVGWLRTYTGALAFTPTHFGPVMQNVNTGVTVTARFSFFRYADSDVGPTGLMQGDRIRFTRI